MKTAIPTDSLSIDYLELDQWSEPVRTLDGYELILIQTGTGYHVVTDKQFAYQPGDVFLIGPHDTYSFLFTQRTSLYRLGFAPLYITSLETSDSCSWNYLNRSSYLGPMSTDATERGNLGALVAILLSEVRSFRPLTDNPVVDSLMKTVLSLVDRLFVRHGFARHGLAQRETVTVPRHTYSSELTSRVAAYISRHIGEPDRLRMNTIADTFNYSPGHLSALFKQQVGDSIQQFIIRHKLKLVASKLRQTPLTVSQIADEFGFSDVCHLNKLFKRHYNYTPTTYRQSLSSL